MNIDIPSEYEIILKQAVINGNFSNCQEALVSALEQFEASLANEA